LRGYTVVLIASDKGSKTMILLRYLSLYPQVTDPYVKIIVPDRGPDTPKSLGWSATYFYLTTVP